MHVTRRPLFSEAGPLPFLALLPRRPHCLFSSFAACFPCPCHAPGGSIHGRHPGVHGRYGRSKFPVRLKNVWRRTIRPTWKLVKYEMKSPLSLHVCTSMCCQTEHILKFGALQNLNFMEGVHTYSLAFFIRNRNPAKIQKYFEKFIIENENVVQRPTHGISSR